MNFNDATINDLLSSLNNSIDNIRKNPTKIEKIPGNFEIIVRGLNSEKDIQTLFSPEIDSLIFNLFDKIGTGDFENLLNQKEKLKMIIEMIFGKGSFQGPLSNSVLTTIEKTTNSFKYQTMKSCLGKTVRTMKKIRLIMKNLEKDSKRFKKDPEQYKKYKEIIYSIKQVLKFAAIIYKNREIINKKVYKGLYNIVHEDYEFDIPLYTWEEN